ncbi:hypothetical protein EJ08DRAFT_700922 [Tothia fuscella]|uniref:Uncharacterized protein n=1 Tax=Tothia fuscella TaxID=1048955 RepID=A0A9P4NJM4_9PEZI|nr:hypothetical protein EJ08DRAFT_700922 [Tothia fuscella]
MATTHFNSTLEVAVADDDMEISSDAGQQDHHYDIDIDLMDPQDDEQDIDYMLEDEEETLRDVQVPNRDDVMIDDLDDTTLVVEDAMLDDETVPDVQITDHDGMHDDLHSQEQLIPSDNEHTHSNVPDELPQLTEDIPTIPENGNEATSFQHESSTSAPSFFPETLNTSQQDTVSQTESITVQTGMIAPTDADNDTRDNEISYEAEPEVSLGNELGVQAVSSDGTMLSAPTGPTIAAEVSQESAVQSEVNPAAQPESPTNQEGQPENKTADTHEEQTQDEERFDAEQMTEPYGENPPETQDTVEASEKKPQLEPHEGQENESSLEEDAAWTYVHPVTVEYEGLRMSLFPPDDEEDPAATYLLRDNSIADKSIADFFTECRHVLGHSIKEEIELEISCDELDLCISEDSKHCEDTSLSQILHVYVTLTHLDGVESPEPLLIYLTTKTRFSAQLEALFRAESEGKGLSELQLGTAYSDDLPPVDGQAYINANVEDDQTFETKEVLPTGGPDVTETKTANSSELQTTNDAKLPTGQASPLAVSGQEPDQHEGEFDLEEYHEGHNANAEGSIVETTGSDGDNVTVPEADTIPYEDATGAEQPEDEQEAVPEESGANQTGSVDGGDVASSGSSTVKGESATLQLGQSPNPKYPFDDWSRLIMDEDPNDDLPLSLPAVPESSSQKPQIDQSEDTAPTHDLENSSQTAVEETVNDHVDHQSDPTADAAAQKDYEDPAYDLDAANQEWNPDDYEGDYHAEDDTYDGLDYEEEADNSILDELWVDPDQQPEPHLEDTYEDQPVPMTPGGLHQILEEDEDSITYDDDLEETEAQEIDAAQARPTNSPLGKRSREEDTEGGGDDAENQGSSKRSRLEDSDFDIDQIQS